MRILVIDDDPGIRAALRTTLEYEGHDVVAAVTGQEGLVLVEWTTPDLVLLDVEMPGIDGLEVLRRLHSTHESLPVVLISGRATTTMVLDAIRAGVADFLEKPFESDQILRTIQSAMGPPVTGKRAITRARTITVPPRDPL